MNDQRKLGFAETVLQNRYVNGYGANNVGAILCISGEIRTEKVRNVLSILMQKHPLLRAKLSDFSTLASLVITDTTFVPFNYTEKKHVNSGRYYMEDIIDKPFDIDFPLLWQCTLFIDETENRHEIVIKTHHVIMDGVSVASFMEEILHGYNSGEIDTIKMPFLKPSEDLSTTNTSWTRFLLREMWKICFGKTISCSPRQHADIRTTFSDRNTKISFYSFNQDELEKIVMACKHNDTTITALLTASLILATQEVCGKHNIEIIGTPVSTRTNFDTTVPSGDHLGLHIADTKIYLPISVDMDIWNIAKAWKTEMNKYFPIIYPANFHPSKIKNKLINLFSLDNSPYFTSGIGVSSLGNRNYMQTNNTDFLRFEDFYFCCSKRSGGKLMVIYAVKAGKKLELCFAHPSKLITNNQAKLIKVNVISRLLSIIS